MLTCSRLQFTTHANNIAYVYEPGQKWEHRTLDEYQYKGRLDTEYDWHDYVVGSQRRLLFSRQANPTEHIEAKEYVQEKGFRLSKASLKVSQIKVRFWREKHIKLFILTPENGCRTVEITDEKCVKDLQDIIGKITGMPPIQQRLY